MTLQLIKVPTPFVTMIHNEWNLAQGRMLFCTHLSSEGFTRWLSEPSPVFDLESSLFNYPEFVGGPKVKYAHEETEVRIDAGYCIYAIRFKQDGTVESHVFA